MNMISRLILDHWDAHPLAVDSAEGIACWWLGNAGMSIPLGEVERALSELVDKALAHRVCLADGTTLYSRGPGSG